MSNSMAFATCYRASNSYYKMKKQVRIKDYKLHPIGVEVAEDGSIRNEKGQPITPDPRYGLPSYQGIPIAILVINLYKPEYRFRLLHDSFICFEDGNPMNNHAKNIKLKSIPEQLVRHMKPTPDVEPTKEKVRYTDEQICEVFRLLLEGKTNVEVEELTGIPSEYVSNLKTGRRRKKLYNEYYKSKHNSVEVR
jgi:hypothetical protein